MFEVIRCTLSRECTLAFDYLHADIRDNCGSQRTHAERTDGRRVPHERLAREAALVSRLFTCSLASDFWFGAGFGFGVDVVSVYSLVLLVCSRQHRTELRARAARDASVHRDGRAQHERLRDLLPERRAAQRVRRLRHRTGGVRAPHAPVRCRRPHQRCGRLLRHQRALHSV